MLKNFVGGRNWKLCSVFTPFFLVHDDYSVHRSCSSGIFDAEDLGRLGVISVFLFYFILNDSLGLLYLAFRLLTYGNVLDFR